MQSKLKEKIRNKIQNDSIRYTEEFVFYVRMHVNRYDCLLVNTPFHGNLGDQAIAIAECKWLKEHNIRFLEVPGELLDNGRYKKIYGYLRKKGIKAIYFTGGGNLGSLWMDDETRFRETLESFPETKTFVFPQTVYFDLNTSQGENEFKNSKKIYSLNHHLVIAHRDNKSYDFMLDHFPIIKILLAPDCVLTLKGPYKEAQSRKEIMICIRNDKEKIVADAEFEKLLSYLRNETKEEILFSNTDLYRKIGSLRRKTIVRKKLEEFSNVKLVITDRLHGMVFAAITGTPCIAFDNKSNKISGVYKWIHNDNVIVVNTVDEAIANISGNKKLRPSPYNNEDTLKLFNDALEEEFLNV